MSNDKKVNVEPRIHIINQYVYPDGAPTTIYAEQLADELMRRGAKVVLVGGSGSYRTSSRLRPITPIFVLSTKSNKRNYFWEILDEYFSVIKAIKRYLASEVKQGDTVVAISSPFINIFFIFSLMRIKTKKNILWLLDYFPHSLISLGFPYKLLSAPLNLVWKHALKKWDLVIKVAENLGYREKNAVTYRLWPTIKDKQALLTKMKSKNKKVLYCGNLGITHDAKALINQMNKYYTLGYEVNFYGDGPKARLLPSYVQRKKFASEREMIKVLKEHDIHLVAGTVNNDTGSFPSKALNSIYFNKKIIACGFLPKLQKELLAYQREDVNKNLAKTAQQILAIS